MPTLDQKEAAAAAWKRAPRLRPSAGRRCCPAYSTARRICYVIVKLAFEMSKKMLPTQVTRMRAWVVGVLGMVTDCVPSLGVEATRLLKVAPPSVERLIATLAQLTGDAVVLATFQVTVCELPPAQVTAVLGWVTVNGPAEVTTRTVVEA